MWAPKTRRPSTSGLNASRSPPPPSIHHHHLQLVSSSTPGTCCCPAKSAESRVRSKTKKSPRKQQQQQQMKTLQTTAMLLLSTTTLLLMLLLSVSQIASAEQQVIVHNNLKSFNVAEGMPNNTYIGTVRASDGQVPTMIIPTSSTPEDELRVAFSYNSTTGELFTNSTLDREKREQYDFVLLCMEQFLEVHVTVTVKDINDNAPMFLLPAHTSEFTIDIPENLPRGTRRDLPRAIDLDSPQFSIQEFRMTSPNTPSGAFILVEAGAPNRSVLQGNINLPDDSINPDNPQLMQQLAMAQNVLIPGSPNFQPASAMSSPSSPSSSSSSSSSSSPPSSSALHSGSSGSKINEYKIQLEFNMMLDRENQSNYQLIVEAQDCGRPPLIGKLIVNVNVLDVNDNNPVFSKQLYEVHLKEDTFKGTLVLRVQAHDSDADKNAELSYFITHHSSPSQQLFSIPDTSKGEIFLVNQLDYEIEREHELTIEARDHGKPARSGYATVKVIVDDVKDDPPANQANSRKNSLAGNTNSNNNNSQEKLYLPSSEQQASKYDILTQREIADVSQNYIQNFNLINWFSQINSTLLFIIVLIALFVVALPVCLVKIKSRQPESDYTDKDGTMNSVESHHSTHPSALALPATPLHTAAPNLHHSHSNHHSAHNHNHNHTHHSHSILPLPSSHLQLHPHGTSSLQRHQMPSASPCNAPAKLDTWPQRPACSSIIDCLPPGVGTPMHGASNSTLDCAYTAPLDRWFDLGVSSQLVYAHDWYGSYNWDYLSDWTPEYRTILP